VSLPHPLPSRFARFQQRAKAAAVDADAGLPDNFETPRQREP
jgi:hypothetical protein